MDTNRNKGFVSSYSWIIRVIRGSLLRVANRGMNDEIRNPNEASTPKAELSPGVKRRFRWSWSLTWAAALFAGAILLLVLFLRPIDQSDILKAAYAHRDGGGYCGLNESGVSEAIIHKGITILPKSKTGSYCCGYTFAVAMQIATERGLLDEKDAYEVKRCQREWYGATSTSNWRQSAMAMENLGIGREVPPQEAMPGDFAVIHRIRGAGHSVIFLNWIKHDGTIVGFRYRSSQPTTDGVGDSQEYFDTSGYKGASVMSKHFHVGRLNPA